MSCVHGQKVDAKFVRNAFASEPVPCKGFNMAQSGRHD